MKLSMMFPKGREFRQEYIIANSVIWSYFFTCTDHLEKSGKVCDYCLKFFEIFLHFPSRPSLTQSHNIQLHYVIATKLIPEGS